MLNISKRLYFFFYSARTGGRIMQSLPSEKRSKIIQDYARSLLSNMDKITEANKLDFDLAQKSSTIYSPILDFLYFVQHKLLNKISPLKKLQFLFSISSGKSSGVSSSAFFMMSTPCKFLMECSLK